MKITVVNVLKILFMLPIILLLAACGSTDSEDAIEVGADAPDFSLPDAAGGEVALSDYSGRPVLLYFHMAVG